MKKIFSTIFIMTAMGNSAVGTISAIKGNISVLRNGISSKVFQDFGLENSDSIITGNDGKVQIIFNDNTTIRLGKNTNFEIVNFSFGEGRNSEVNLKVKSGFFSAITGEIGKVNHDKFKLETKNSTIGIRGTHFQGLIGNSDEDIACLDGMIFVETAGEKIDVAKGEILVIRDGIPEAVKTIKSIDVKNMEDKASLDDPRAEIQASLDALSSIKDSDIKIAQYKMIFDQINGYINDLIFKAGLIKSPVILSSNDNSVNMGVYSSNNLNFQANDSLETKLSVLEAANLGDIYFANKITNSVAPFTLSTEPHWSGKNSGSIINYEGQILFIGDMDEKTISIDPVTKIKDNELIKQNGVQKISISINTLNSLTSGKFIYLNNPILFQTSGTGAVTNSNFAFFGNNLLENSSVTNQIAFNQLSNGYINNNIYSTVLIQPYNYYSLSKTDQDKSYITFGGMVATKVSETKLTKQEEAKNDHFSWGYWAEETEPEKLHGGWIESIATETSAEKIAEWKTGGFKASYSGDIVGTVRNLSGDSYKMENGTFGFDFDFGKKSVAGQMSFKANSENYDLAFLSSNSIAENGNSFSFNKTSTTSNSQEFIDYGVNNKAEYIYGSGKFFGSNGETVGGGFTAGFKNGNIATGAIYGNKQ